MFQNLTDRLQATFAKLTRRGALTESDIDEALREVRMALLEADVNFTVAKSFVAGVRERAIGQDVVRSLTPGQTVVKIVMEELTVLMGGTGSRLVLSSRIPNVLMLVGLQGSGKTTAAAKLARRLAEEGRSPHLIACDVYRPAAIEQLVALGAEIGVPVYHSADNDPVAIAQAGVKDAIARMRDVVIIDTAGRLHIDEEMMAEAERISRAVRPDQILMVVDAMTGQDAVTAASAFAARVDFDGVVMTKLDGDARGGAALSVKAVTGKPILFVGTGERTDALEPFYPDRMARRMLGMGDVVSLIEKAQQTTDESQAADLEARLRAGEFTLDDFREQLRQVRKMGSLSDLLAMVPGMGKLPKDAALDEGALARTEAIIQSMTPREREKPSLINGSRRARIAAGAGVGVYDVNQLLKQFVQAKKMIRQMQTGPRPGGKRRRGGMPGFPPLS